MDRTMNREKARQTSRELRGLKRWASDAQILRFADLEARLAGRAQAARDAKEWEQIGERLRKPRRNGRHG